MTSMRTVALVSGVAAGVGGLGAALRHVRRAGPPAAAARRLGVTVLATAEDIAPDGALPEPLRRLGDTVEITMRPAPGGRGTELYARPTGSAPPSGVLGRVTGQDASAPVRRALREAKALVETGATVRSDESRTTHPGPAGRVLRAVDRGAQGAGRL